MKKAKQTLLSALVAVTVAAVPGAASALTWTFSSGNCADTTGPSGNCADTSLSSTRTYNASTGAGTVTVSGWANTADLSTGGTDNKVALGQITQYSGGLGVKNADASTSLTSGDYNEGNDPEHAIDNNQRTDLVLFNFGANSVNLQSISLGWYNTDTDLSVLAYTGSGDPTSSLGNRKLTSTAQDLTTNGWTLIGNYDVDSGDTTNPYTKDISGDSQGIKSSYWIVSSFSSGFGTCTGCQIGDDYFKILTVAGTIPATPRSGVPEPATALLLGFGVPLARRFAGRRR